MGDHTLMRMGDHRLMSLIDHRLMSSIDHRVMRMSDYRLVKMSEDRLVKMSEHRLIIDSLSLSLSLFCIISCLRQFRVCSFTCVDATPNLTQTGLRQPKKICKWVITL